MFEILSLVPISGFNRYIVECKFVNVMHVILLICDLIDT